MADKTGIEWTDATWNPVVGCSIVTPGCTNCYAMRQAARIENIDAKQRLRTFADHASLDEAHPEGRDPARTAMLEPRTHYAGTTKQVNGKAVWTGKMAIAPDHILTQPLRWRRPRRIFVNSMSDLFHDDVPDEWIDRVFAVMALSPQHTFQVLTKRPERMRAFLAQDRRDIWSEAWSAGTLPITRHECQARLSSKATPDQRWLYNAERVAWPLPNVWLGVSIEDQRRADERVPILLDTPAAVRWVSAEPSLGPIDLMMINRQSPLGSMSALPCEPGGTYLDWVVIGGESGPGARPMHPDWARSLRDQCAAAGVPFLFKQWGEWEPALDRDRDDPDWRRDYRNDYADRGKSRWLNLAGGRGFHGDRLHVMRRVGKRAAGRHLDGVLHDAYPEGRP